MALPPLTPEQRAAALEKAAEARRVRAEVKNRLKHSGASVFDVIEKAPERLREVEGIGQVRLTRITAGWADQKAIREIMVFLQSHGLGTSRSVRIFKTFGADAIPLVKENPYRLPRHPRYRLQDC